MTKPAKWSDPTNKLFPHQVGFTAPPMDFDAAPLFEDLLSHKFDAIVVNGIRQAIERSDDMEIRFEGERAAINGGGSGTGRTGEILRDLLDVMVDAADAAGRRSRST